MADPCAPVSTALVVATVLAYGVLGIQAAVIAGVSQIQCAPPSPPSQCPDGAHRQTYVLSAICNYNQLQCSKYYSIFCHKHVPVWAAAWLFISMAAIRFAVLSISRTDVVSVHFSPNLLSPSPSFCIHILWCPRVPVLRRPRAPHMHDHPVRRVGPPAEVRCAAHNGSEPHSPSMKADRTSIVFCEREAELCHSRSTAFLAHNCISQYNIASIPHQLIHSVIQTDCLRIPIAIRQTLIGLPAVNQCHPHHPHQCALTSTSCHPPPLLCRCPPPPRRLHSTPAY